MKIAFVTTQSPSQSTIVGRILPLAIRLNRQHQHQVDLLGHEGDKSAISSSITWHAVGQNPFHIHNNQKVRDRGFALIARLTKNVIKTFQTLNTLQPDAIVIVKPLPQNVAAVSLYCRWRALIQSTLPHIVLDIDDYELTANQLTSLGQRAFVHWSEQEAHRLCQAVTVASPFLKEYSRQLAPDLKRFLIPTSADLPDKVTPSCDSVAPTVIYIGSLSITSGHRIDLLPIIWKQVVEQLPKARLRIAGDGHDIDFLRQQFKTSNVETSVTFTGRFSSANLPDLLADVCLIVDPIDASLTNRAKSSYRASLAAFLGLPYVSSNIGIRPTWFPTSHHEQFFAKPEDADDYAAKIVRLLQHPLSAQDQQIIQQHSQRFSWDVLANLFNKSLTV